MSGAKDDTEDDLASQGSVGELVERLSVLQREIESTRKKIYQLPRTYASDAFRTLERKLDQLVAEYMKLQVRLRHEEGKPSEH